MDKGILKLADSAELEHSLPAGFAADDDANEYFTDVYVAESWPELALTLFTRDCSTSLPPFMVMAKSEYVRHMEKRFARGRIVGFAKTELIAFMASLPSAELGRQAWYIAQIAHALSFYGNREDMWGPAWSADRWIRTAGFPVLRLASAILMRYPKRKDLLSAIVAGSCCHVVDLCSSIALVRCLVCFYRAEASVERERHFGQDRCDCPCWRKAVHLPIE
jgi:hypothetical protein